MSNTHSHPSRSTIPLPDDQPTIPLWPDAGRALGLQRSAAYAAAARGEIPGLIRIGRRYRVATATLRAALGLDVPAAG
jgi:hypothetical protein